MNKFLLILFSDLHVLSAANQDKNNKQIPLKLKGVLSILCERHVFTAQDIFNYKFGLILSQDYKASALIGCILKKQSCDFHCAMIFKKEDDPIFLIGFYPNNFGLSFYLSKTSLGVTLNFRQNIDCFVLDLGAGGSYNIDYKSKPTTQPITPTTPTPPTPQPPKPTTPTPITTPTPTTPPTPQPPKPITTPRATTSQLTTICQSQKNNKANNNQGNNNINAHDIKKDYAPNKKQSNTNAIKITDKSSNQQKTTKVTTYNNNQNLHTHNPKSNQDNQKKDQLITNENTQNVHKSNKDALKTQQDTLQNYNTDKNDNRNLNNKEALKLFTQAAQKDRENLTRFLKKYNLKKSSILCSSQTEDDLGAVYRHYLEFKNNEKNPSFEKVEDLNINDLNANEALFTETCSSIILGLIGENTTWRDENHKQCIILMASNTQYIEDLAALYKLCFDTVIIPYNKISNIENHKELGHFTAQIRSQDNTSSELNSNNIQGDGFSCGYYAATYCFLLHNKYSKEDIDNIGDLTQEVLTYIKSYGNKMPTQVKQLVAAYEKNKQLFESNGRRIAILVLILYLLKKGPSSDDLNKYYDLILKHINQYAKPHNTF